MRNRTFEYVFQQVMWLLGTAAQLVASMGVGLKWVFMTFRCITFAMLDLAYFIPHVFWYLLSPNIIRRVSYRSSHTTKLRNLEALLSQQAAPEPAEPSSGISFAWKDRKGGSKGREGSPAGPLSEEPGAVDYEAVERFARTINPADGTFVNGLPVDAADDLNNATSFFPGALNMKNSFDDTLAALQRIYRHRTQQQQQQQQQMAKSTSMNASTSHNASNPAAAADEEAAAPPSPPAESFTDSDNDDDVEDRMNLHNRATLDIYLPIPLDSLFRFMDQERKTSEATTPRPGTTTYAKHGSDVKGKASKSDKHKDAAHHNKSRLTRKKFPILISVNGGAWIVGCYLWNFLIARLFAARGYVVFCPDYRNFPQTTMEGMTLDVSDAVAWVLNNAERYNGDLSNVTLIGQSAGAHLTMMSLLSQAQLSAYRSNTMHSTYEGVPPPSDVAYNVPRYNPREFIHRYVGLSGMYNVEGLVDHFQREGLNTPVLHQIAGGRDQLPRYSIHAYFDDRRGGDTGEVLPDNIFDYFPQRMFFVHGDADKCAPVTESASLVAMLRSAQDRYALRRRERNEEARRHALRSRRLLPGALAPQAAGVAATCNPTAAPYPHRAEAYAEEDVYGGGAHRNVHTPASAAWAQWGAGEEDGNDCCRGAEGDQDRERALYGGYEHLAAAAGGGGGRMSIGPPIFVSDTATRRSGGLGAATTSTAQQQQQHQQQQMYGPPTVVSPIVPPSRTDQPKSAVELEFIVIPNGRHSDAFVDECIAAGRSCCVDLLCDYESAVDCPSRSFSPSLARSVDDDSLCGSVTGAASHWGERVPTWMSQSSQVCAMPDGILPLAVPTEERSFPLRLCTLICPF